MALSWISSYPKSGNTWMRLFISAYDYGRIDINKPQGVMMDDLFHYYWQIVSPKPVHELTSYECNAMRGAVLLHILHSNEYNAVLKTHSMYGIHRGFSMIPREMTDRVIHIVRDPRDVCVSWAKYSRQDPSEIVQMLIKNVDFQKQEGLWNTLGSWNTYQKSWIQAKEEEVPVLILRYEDMVEDSVHEFNKVIRFVTATEEQPMGKVDGTRLLEAIELTSIDNLRIQELAKGFREHTSDRGDDEELFFRTGKAGNYKEALTDSQVQEIEQNCGEMMEVYGYD